MNVGQRQRLACHLSRSAALMIMIVPGVGVIEPWEVFDDVIELDVGLFEHGKELIKSTRKQEASWSAAFLAFGFGFGD